MNAPENDPATRETAPAEKPPPPPAPAPEAAGAGAPGSSSAPGESPENDAKHRIIGSAPVQITLLALYSLPLILLALTPFASGGYLEPSVFVEATFKVVARYVAELRDAFAVFVVPFVTAMSSGRWDGAAKGGLKPIHTFFIFIAMLTLSIVLHAYIGTKGGAVASIQVVEPDKAQENVESALAILNTYTKEVLTYISLLLGVSLWRRS